MHNVLVHHLWRNDPRRRVMDYLESPVYTAGFVRGGDFEIDVLGRLRHARGMPAVHHQLNRHEAAWLEILAHWNNRLNLNQPSDSTRQRYAAAAKGAASSAPLASVGRADPRHFNVEQAVAGWPIERFRATNDSWCGNTAGFIRSCNESALPPWMWRVDPIPDSDFRCQ